MNEKQKALLLVILIALLSAGNSPVQKIGLFSIPPLTFAFIRFFLSSLIILPLLIKSRKNLIKELRSLFPMTLFASINIVVFILGLKLTTATIAQLLYAAGPLLTGIIAFRLLGEKLTTRSIAGIIVGFIGIAIVVLLPLIEKGGEFSGNLIGNLLIGIGVLCYSVYLVLSKRVQKHHSPVAINNAFIIITTLLLFPFFLFEQVSYPSWLRNVTLSGSVSLLYTVVFGTVSMYLIKQHAIKRGGPFITAMSMYLVPIFTFILAYFLLGERLTTGLIIGAALALLGIFIASRG